MTSPYRDPEWLERQYHDEGLTQREIGEKCGVSPRTIWTYMQEFGIETREIAGENYPLYGEERSEETKEKISDALTDRTFSEETRRRLSEAQRNETLPEDAREKISDSLTGITRSRETREKMSRSTADENNPNWKGGYSHRYGAGWSTARDRVRDRDGVCQHCGKDASAQQLEVHHIIPVRAFREADHLSLEDAHRLENLVLLCRQCHPRADHGLIPLESGLESLFE